MGLLDNKIVLITGASSGIGKACALDFAREGAKLILTARRRERLEDLAKQLKKEFNTKSRVLYLDVRKHRETESVFNSLPDEWKNVDVLINNAGLARV